MRAIIRNKKFIRSEPHRARRTHIHHWLTVLSHGTTGISYRPGTANHRNYPGPTATASTTPATTGADHCRFGDRRESQTQRCARRYALAHI